MIFAFIGTTELLLIGGIALLLFGGKKLPEMMRGLGKGVKEFKEGMNGDGQSPDSVPKEGSEAEETAPDGKTIAETPTKDTDDRAKQ